MHRIDTREHKFIEDQSQNLRVGQVVKVSQNERFPADLILLKSSNPDGMAYVETLALDGETNLKHKSAIRDMQDTILSASDASKINANVYCDNPDDSLYNFDGLMTIKVKNSESQYKYPLSYSQLLLRGSSLKTTHWVYGIVVYTGHETKMQMHEAVMPRRQKKMSRVEKLADKFIKWLFCIQVILAAIATSQGEKFEATARDMSYLHLDPRQASSEYATWLTSMLPQILAVVKFGNWMLLLM